MSSRSPEEIERLRYPAQCPQCPQCPQCGGSLRSGEYFCSVECEQAWEVLEAIRGVYVEVDERCTKVWYNSAGEVHRDGDLPAVIWEDGTRFWHRDGEEHRDGGRPAVVWCDGDLAFYENGKFVRWERSVH